MPTKEPVRCKWSHGGNDAYIAYHDTEWGVPCRDDRKQFEFLVLESAQAGLSWATILNKRAGYKKEFADFDPERVARFTEKRIEKILLNPGIIRNRLKVLAAVKNAKAFLQIQEEYGSFHKYIWGFVDGKPVYNKWKRHEDIPCESDASIALAKDMKSRGFQFLGKIILYSHMQALGLYNDHLVDCFRHKACAAMHKKSK